MHKIFMQVTLSYKVKEKKALKITNACSKILKDGGIQFDIKAEAYEPDTFEGTLKEMVEQIMLRKLIENLDGGGDTGGQASDNDTVIGPSPSKTRLGKMVNRIAESSDGPNMFIFTENKEEFNEGRTPCLLISASPRTPTLPWKQLMRDSNTVIRDGAMRLRWSDGPLPWTAWMEIEC